MPHRPYSDPEKAVRKKIADRFKAVQDGRIHIEKINAPFLYREHATPAYESRPRSGDRARLAGAARQRNLCEVHAGGRGPVRLIRIFRGLAYLGRMPRSPFDPCIPTKAAKVPDRPEWIHEMKHDGYRLIVQRDGKRVWLWTRNGHD